MLRNATPRCTPRCTPRHTLRGAVSTLDSLQRSFNTESAATPKRPSPSLLHRSAVFKPKERGVLTGRREGSTPPLHYVAPQEDEKRLLRPAVLSERIQRLCGQGNIDDAVLMLKNAPLDAQNTIVWNTMMSEALKVKRFKLAYQTYIDMKRRGFNPICRTFTTLLAGFSKIPDWRLYPNQLDNVHTIMQNYKQFIEAEKEKDPQSPELSVIPFARYINILGDARQYQKMFDVYYAMDDSGPLAPDNWIYASLLHALSERHVVVGESSESIHAKNASDARLLWKQAVKAAEKRPFEFDAHVIVSLLRCLMRGRPSDVLFGLDVIHDYCGLSKPGEDPLPPKVPLNPHVITAILELCNINHKYRLAVHYMQQIMDRPLRANEILPLDRNNMEQLLQSYAFMAAIGSSSEADQALETLQWMLRQEVLNPELGQKMRPRLETYSLVLVACWRGADWASATRTFELLTGCIAEEFRDGGLRTPKIVKRSQGRSLQPDNTALSALLRTALATKDRANMRQSLRMADFFGVEEMLEWLITAMGTPPEQTGVSRDDEKWKMKFGEKVNSRRAERHRKFYGAKLAEVVADLVDKVTPKAMATQLTAASASEEHEDEGTKEQNYVATEEERTRWRALQRKAKEALRLVRSLKSPLTGPRHEDEPLGSARGLARTDQQVDWDMATRHAKSAKSLVI